ncbi:MAG: cell division protein ZapE [Chromatiaceae bacterium]|nr:AFG1 family ATPase [Gammaproteobacteria bacterium]MCP5314608.1 cell division protein ZapE [Chromatiaceae bacterium]
MSLTAFYERRLAADGLIADAHQRQAVAAFDRLITDLDRPAVGGWKRWLRPAEPPVRGVYLWGGVGRGKTWLMDLFHDNLDGVAKTRLHFHRFMQLVHAEMAAIKGKPNPLQIVAAQMRREWRLLCLDEFNVVDIGDAVILAGLLRSLFEQGVALVTTSNVAPEHLYRDGIQRASFLPAIDLLSRHTEVVELAGERDFRKMILEQERVYHWPLGAETDAALGAEFDRLANTDSEGPGDLVVNGRTMPYRRRAEDIVWFDFEALCGPPRSQNDYIELARCHQTVFMSDIPVMGGSRDDRTRRFIFLIDEFYDRRVKLILSAEAPAARLYIGERLAFEFQRTVSRLTEMQTAAYLGRAHLG